MRIGPVVFWVLAAAALGVLVVLTRGSGGPSDGPAESSLTLGIDIAAVRSIRTDGDDGVSIERSSAGVWLVRWVRSGDAVVWPADAELSRAGLRVLAAASFSARTDGNPPTTSRSMRVRTDDGEVLLRWGGQPIAGRLAAEIDRGDGAQAVWMEDRLARALEPESLMRWRSAAIMQTASRPVEFQVAMPGRSVALSSADGVWRLDGARALAVDQALMDETVRDLGTLLAESFEPIDADAPAAASIRVAGLDGSTRTLELLGAMNASGTRFAARVMGEQGGTPLGPVGVVIDAGPLGSLSPVSREYLSGTAVDGSRVDVASVELISGTGDVRARASRAIDGWRSDVDDEMFGSLVSLLTRTEASAVGDGSGLDRAGVVRIRDAALDAPLDVEIGRRSDGAGVLVVRGGAFDVSFEYTDPEAQRVIAWAADQLD